MHQTLRLKVNEENTKAIEIIESDTRPNSHYYIPLKKKMPLIPWSGFLEFLFYSFFL